MHNKLFMKQKYIQKRQSRDETESEEENMNSDDADALKDIFEDAENYHSESESKLQDDEEDLNRGDMESENEPESEEDDVSEKRDSNLLDENAADVIEITPDRFQQIIRNFQSSSTGSIRSIVKIFSSVFNEQTSKSVVKYSVSDPSVLSQIYSLYFDKIPSIISKIVETEKSRILKLSYIKNAFLYLTKTKEEAILASCLNSIKSFYELYLSFPSLNKKLIKFTLNLWSDADKMACKFVCYSLIKKMYELNENESKITIFKNLLLVFAKFSGSISWRNYDKYVFMLNCCCDLAFLNSEISYIVIFDKLKDLSARIIDVSKHKVCSTEFKRCETTLQLSGTFIFVICQRTGILMRSKSIHNMKICTNSCILSSSSYSDFWSCFQVRPITRISFICSRFSIMFAKKPIFIFPF